jgi:lipocalin
MNHRSKPAGWRYESFRHSQAARGIPSGRTWQKKFIDARRSDLYLAKKSERESQDEQVREKLAEKIALADMQIKQLETARDQALEDGNYRSAAGFSKDILAQRTLQDRLKAVYERTSTNEYLAMRVDLSRYAGTWEQESVENEPWFQRGCKDVTANYKLNRGGTVKVTNTCDGKKIEGTAKSVSRDNRKLEVSFGPFQRGEYNIAKVNKDYTRAVVKSGKTTWVLRRKK